MALQVVNTTQKSVLANRAVEAKGFYNRFRGLMGRRELPVGEGLLITPCTSIHTFFMRIPIDALFLDQQGTVIKLLSALPPWRVSGVYFKARSVLELPAGVAAATRTREGDVLRLISVEGDTPRPV